ncbi:unnamed protein product [Caenorhabditis auriculariae]|uniref:Uncharacterized protein n=1 Tax=Caenorhabditis auriculariae TaxID=2777116 RepID=A0A8S1HE30_9PELO|nr:unnamed protein product [Caenorhabditis auriculariae]
MRSKPWLPIIILFIALISEFRIGTEASLQPTDLKKYQLDEKGFEKVRTIHSNWYVHSVKALIVQLSKELLPKLQGEIKSDFLLCLSHIRDKKDVAAAAHCLLEARHQYQKFLIERKMKKTRKNGDQKIRTRVKRSLRRLVVDSVSKSDSEGFVVKSMKSMPNLKSTDQKTPVQKVAGLLQAIFKNATENSTNSGGTSWTETYKSIVELKKRLDAREKGPGAKVYNQRMHDLVLDVPEQTSALIEHGMPEIVKKTPSI